MWRETTKHERNLRIFREELDDFLPQKILDFHAHIFNKGIMPDGETFSCAGHSIAKYDFDDLRQDLQDAYPGRETFAVCFGSPNAAYDRECNNRSVSANCDRIHFFPFRLFDTNENDPETVERDIIENRFLGLKPYRNYVRKDDPEAVEVYDMLPPWIMEIADRLSLIIMLHIPKKARLADPSNLEQVARLCGDYPNAKIVLAHIGRAYYLKNITGNLDGLKSFPNLWYDIAMLNNWEVLEYLFKTVRHDRVLFATDIPIALAPGKSVEINDQYTYITPVPWELSISDDHAKLVFTSFLYEELRAVKKAVQRLELGREFVRGFFYDNGARLLESVPSIE